MENSAKMESIAVTGKQEGKPLTSIKLSGVSFVKSEDAAKKIRANELFHLSSESPIDELAGVCIDGVHYYDFKHIHTINNTGLASLIDLLKCLMLQGVNIQFVNVNERIKQKIKAMGLENILTCS